jgi:hypothetical protein
VFFDLFFFQKMTTSFSPKLIYETAVNALASGNRLSSPFDPSTYPLVTITRLANRSKDSFDNKNEATYSVHWHFPVTVKCATDKLGSDDSDGDDNTDKNAGPKDPPLFPNPPGPTSVGCHLSFPSGSLGQSSRSGRSWSKKTEAKDWPTYMQAYNALIDQVQKELATSNYLGFNAKNPGPSSGMQIALTPSAKDKTKIGGYSVHISGSSTDGWGEYDLETKKWDGLRHKHRARDYRDVAERDMIIYCGENIPEKVFAADPSKAIPAEDD